MKRLFTGFILLALSACGQEGPDAIQPSAIKKELQKYYEDYYDNLPAFEVEDIDVLAVENTGSETEPVYDIRINITASLPYDSYDVVYTDKDHSVVAFVAEEGTVEEKQSVIRVKQRTNGEWRYSLDFLDWKIRQHAYKVWGYPIDYAEWTDPIIFESDEEVKFRKRLFEGLKTLPNGDNAIRRLNYEIEEYRKKSSS